MRRPGAGADRVVLVLALAVLGTGRLSAQDIRFRERVEVERLLIDARVVDGRGQPVHGLALRDFRVSIDDRLVPLESVHWVSRTVPYAEGLPPGPALAAGAPAAPPGRLIVFLFQKDMETSRIAGLMRMKRWAARFLETLEPTDRVAVLSYDSHLKLWTDFTMDRARLARVVEHSILFERPPIVDPGPFPSLAAGFDRRAAKRAATLETALLVTARALSELPGAKSLALFGWGLGRFTGSRVVMENDYDEAREALAAARVSVFCMDITDADYHTLEVALVKVAEDTGGFYVKTHDFPSFAMARLEGALSGHYVLAVEKPRRAGPHRLEIDLVGRKGTVLAPTSYVD